MCNHATQLWHEIKAQGYAGGRRTLARYLGTFSNNLGIAQHVELLGLHYDLSRLLGDPSR